MPHNTDRKRESHFLSIPEVYHLMGLTKSNGACTSKKRVFVSLFLGYYLYAKSKMIQPVILELMLIKVFWNPIPNRSLTLFLSWMFFFDVSLLKSTWLTKHFRPSPPKIVLIHSFTSSIQNLTLSKISFLRCCWTKNHENDDIQTNITNQRILPSDWLICPSHIFCPFFPFLDAYQYAQNLK